MMAGALLFAGHLWFAWTLLKLDRLGWALLVFFVPFPVLALMAWWQADWNEDLQHPALVYFGGYGFMALIGGI
jgi:hypothetical protein